MIMNFLFILSVAAASKMTSDLETNGNDIVIKNVGDNAFEGHFARPDGVQVDDVLRVGPNTASFTSKQSKNDPGSVFKVERSGYFKVNLGDAEAEKKAVNEFIGKMPIEVPGVRERGQKLLDK